MNATPSQTHPVITTPVSPPSVHVRAAITWLAIFPLVAIGMMLLAPISENWHPVLRALALTVVVVPLVVEDKADGTPEKRLKKLRRELRREVRAVKHGW